VIGRIPTLLDLAVRGSPQAPPVRDGPIPVRTLVGTEEALEGEILVWVKDGYLSGLEFAWFTDDPPSAFHLPSGCSIGMRNGPRTCSELVPAEANRVKAATRRADYILMARDVQSEGRALAGSKAEAVAALSWEELDAYDQTVEEVVGPSGTQYRLSTSVFWDMEPWASGMYVIVKAAPTRGWRRFWPFKAVEVRGGPDDLVPEKATG
jgi:hypothetical protein